MVPALRGSRGSPFEVMAMGIAVAIAIAIRIATSVSVSVARFAHDSVSVARFARKKRGSSAEAFHVLVLRWPQGLKPEMKRRKKGADDARCPPALSSDEANGHQG